MNQYPWFTLSGRYSDESTPVFRSKVLQLIWSNVRQRDRPSHYMGESDIIQT